MSRTYRRCGGKKTGKPKQISFKSFPFHLQSMLEDNIWRKTFMADDPWIKRFLDVKTIKFRSKRRRRMRERLLASYPDPDCLFLPGNLKRNYFSDSIF